MKLQLQNGNSGQRPTLIAAFVQLLLPSAYLESKMPKIVNSCVIVCAAIHPS